jgi:glyoxylase-like metal-dependent hydrolase (beta-lactamase superfamily II)
LTHHHDDHAGFLGPLTRDNDLTVIAHRGAEALLAGGANDKSHGGGFVTRRMNLLARIKMRLDPNWTLTFPPFLLRPNDIRVDSDDDELLRSFGIPGRVLTTPGHTVDSLSVSLNDGSAFCGDAAANVFRVAGTRHCTVFMTDMDAAYDSWRKLIAAGARTIYPAHGRPFDVQLLRRDLDAHSTAELVRFF